MADWETVVGLEVHAELATTTKLFCGCRNAFGDSPNTNVCPVCLGLPGSLPVLNARAVDFAVRLGVALHCTAARSTFARKNYFYPDMPKDYQISQYDLPVNVDGWLALPSGQRVGIERAHMEEDTGKSTHVGGGGRIHEAGYSLVDYNRAGVPLVEIVGRPDLRSASEAREYVSELRAVLVAIGVSDAQDGRGLDAGRRERVGAAVGASELGTRCEIKNLNSLRSLGRAIEYEARRQIDVLSSGGRVAQETRHWNEDDGRTHLLRSKEEADDYRYFPEPDLVPVVPTDEWVASIASTLPLLPADRRERLASAAGVSSSVGAVAVAVARDLDGLALGAIAAGADAGRVLTHVEHNLAVDGAESLRPSAFASLVGLETSGRVTATQAKSILAELVSAGGDGDPEAIARVRGFEAMEAGTLGMVVDQAIEANPGAWEKYLAGEDKAAGALLGWVMKTTDRRADGKAVTALLAEKRAHQV